MSTGSLEARDVKCPGAGVTGGNNLPNMGSENPAHTLEEHTAERLHQMVSNSFLFCIVCFGFLKQGLNHKFSSSWSETHGSCIILRNAWLCFLFFNYCNSLVNLFLLYYHVYMYVCAGITSDLRTCQAYAVQLNSTSSPGFMTFMDEH